MPPLPIYAPSESNCLPLQALGYGTHSFISFLFVFLIPGFYFYPWIFLPRCARTHSDFVWKSDSPATRGGGFVRACSAASLAFPAFHLAFPTSSLSRCFSRPPALAFFRRPSLLSLFCLRARGTRPCDRSRGLYPRLVRLAPWRRLPIRLPIRRNIGHITKTVLFVGRRFTSPVHAVCACNVPGDGQANAALIHPHNRL